MLELAKDLAMHVAASQPEYISSSEVPQERLNEEKDVLKNIKFPLGNLLKTDVRKIAEAEITVIRQSSPNLTIRNVPRANIKMKNAMEIIFGR